VDSRRIAVNPLHKAFKAKSFTRNDIALHFILMDMLEDGEGLSARQIADRAAQDYLSKASAEAPDESTVRKKLNEYVELGLIEARARGRERLYFKSRDGVDLSGWADAIRFYSEADGLGVIGSFLLDRLGGGAPDLFRFKHHYLTQVLESEPMLAALRAIRERRNVRLVSGAGGAKGERRWPVTPLKVLAGTQTGRTYLCAFDPSRGKLCCYRMDRLREIEPLGEEPKYPERAARFAQVERHLWGAGIRSNRSVSHVEMTVFAGPGEQHIPRRLEREKRCGRVEQLDDTHWRFSADVYDPYEVVPWARSFIGRITDFRCGDEAVAARFRDDMRAMLAMYGGQDAVQ